MFKNVHLLIYLATSCSFLIKNLLEVKLQKYCQNLIKKVMKNEHFEKNIFQYSKMEFLSDKVNK